VPKDEVELAEEFMDRVRAVYRETFGGMLTEFVLVSKNMEEDGSMNSSVFAPIEQDVTTSAGLMRLGSLTVDEWMLGVLSDMDDED